MMHLVKMHPLNWKRIHRVDTDLNDFSVQVVISCYCRTFALGMWRLLVTKESTLLEELTWRASVSREQHTSEFVAFGSSIDKPLSRHILWTKRYVSVRESSLDPDERVKFDFCNFEFQYTIPIETRE